MRGEAPVRHRAEIESTRRGWFKPNALCVSTQSVPRRTVPGGSDPKMRLLPLASGSQEKVNTQKDTTSSTQCSVSRFLISSCFRTFVFS